MARGEQIEQEADRALSCANCERICWLKFRMMDRLGRTGFHFCPVEYRETGEFTEQPWDYTCPDHRPRVRVHDRNKCVAGDSIPAVAEPIGYEA